MRVLWLVVLLIAVLPLTPATAIADEETHLTYADVRTAIRSHAATEEGQFTLTGIEIATTPTTVEFEARVFDPSPELMARLGLEPDSPSVPLIDAAILIEALRDESLQVAEHHPALARAFEEVSGHAVRYVELGLDEARRAVQPSAALMDRTVTLRSRVYSLFHDVVWSWAKATRRRWGSPWEQEQEGPVPAPAARSLAEIKKRARDVVTPELVLQVMQHGNELEYHLPSIPRGLDDFDAWGNITFTQARAEQVRGFAKAREAAGRKGVLAFWTPVIDYIEGYVEAAIEELREANHARFVLEERTQIWDDRAVDAILTRLWSHAMKSDLSLWPLEEYRPRIESAPETDKGEIPFYSPPRMSSEVEAVPAEYKTVTKTVMVEPERIETRKIEAVYEMRDGVRVLVSPERTIEVVIPAKYETVEEQVCVQPASAKRVRLPAAWIKISVAEEFGKIQGVWFLDAWSWKKFEKYRPDPESIWDKGSPRPPSPWVDLLSDPDALTRRKRPPLIKGWVVIVGTTGASGPSRVTFGAEKPPNVFSVVKRKVAKPAQPSTK